MQSKSFRKLVHSILIISLITTTIGPIGGFAAPIDTSTGAPYSMVPQTIATNSPQTAAFGLNLSHAATRTVTAVNVTVAGPAGSFNPTMDLDGMNPVGLYSDAGADGVFDFATDTQISSSITALNPNGVRLSSLTPSSVGTYTINGATNTPSTGLFRGDIVFGIYDSSLVATPTWGIVTEDLTATTLRVNGSFLGGSPHLLSKYNSTPIAVTTGAAGANPWTVEGGIYTPVNGDMVLYQTGMAPAIWGVVTDASSTNQDTFKINGAALPPSTSYTIAKLNGFATSTTSVNSEFSSTLVDGMDFSPGDLVFSKSGFGGYRWSVVTAAETVTPGAISGASLKFNDEVNSPTFAVGTRISKITPSGNGRAIDAFPTFTSGDALFTYTISDNYLAAYGWKQVLVGGAGGISPDLSIENNSPILYPTTYRIVPVTPLTLPTSPGGHGASGYNLFVTAKTSAAATNSHAFVVALAGIRSIEISDNDFINAGTLYAGAPYLTQQALTTVPYTIGAGGGGDANNTEGTATTIGNATPITSSIASADDVDYYKFTGTHGISYTVSATLSGLMSGTVQATGPTYTSGAAASMPSTITINAAADGTYYVILRGSASNTGDYTVTVTSGGDNTYGGATTITAATPGSASISPAADIDYYKFVPISSQSYTIAVTNTSITSSVITLYGSDGITSMQTGASNTNVVFDGTMGSTYYFKIAESNPAGTGNYGYLVSATGGGGNVPTGLSSSLITSSSISLSWNPVMGAGSYSIQKSTTGIDGMYSDLSNPMGSTYMDLTLSASTQYCYKVAATVGISTSSYSTGYCVSTTAGGGGGGNIPTGLGLGGVVTSDSIPLSWNSVAMGAEYQVARSSSFGGDYFPIGSSTFSTTFTDAALNPSTTYYYKVRSLISATYSAYSSPFSATTSGAGSIDGNDTSFTATLLTVDGIATMADIGPASSDLDYYKFNGTNGITYTVNPTLTLGGGGLPGGIISVTGPGAYSSGPFQMSSDITFTATATGEFVIYISSISTGTYSIQVTAGGGGFTETPAGLSSAGNTSSQINLSWVAVGGGAIYTVKRSNTPDGIYSILINPTPTFNTYADTGLSTGTQYCYKVNASVGGVLSPDSASYCFTPQFDGGDNNNTIGTATAITVGAIATEAAINPTSSDVDYYTFNGTSGNSYTINPTLRTLASGTITVTGAGAYNSGPISMTNDVTFTASATGAFVIHITSGTTGTYALAVTTVVDGGPAPTLTFSGPGNNAMNVPISAFINFMFSSALDLSTLIPANITLTKNVGGTPTNVDYTIIPSYSGLQIAISSKPTFAASSYFSKFANGSASSSIYLNGSLQGPYTPVLGDIVFVQKGNFPPFFGIYTGTGVNGFNLMNGDMITKITDATIAGQVRAVDQTLTVNTGDLMLAYTSDNRDQANGFTWHMVTDGGDMGLHVATPGLNNSVTLDNYSGPVAQNYLSPYFAALTPASTATDNGTTPGNTLTVTQGGWAFVKLANDPTYKWHLVTQGGVLSSATDEITATVDALSAQDSRVAIGSVMSGFPGGDGGPVLADTNSFAVGDVVYAKTTANSAYTNNYTFHMVTKPASTSINNDTLRFDNSTSDLESNTTYTASISANVRGSGGTNLASPITITFTTSGNSTTNIAPPVIQYTIPNTGNMNFPTGSKIAVGFSVPMAIAGAGSVSNTNNVGIYENIFGQPGSVIASTNSYDSSKNEVVITPNSALTANHNYILKINSTTTSLTGTAIPSTRIIAFKTSTTGASTIPTITGTFPGTNATNVNTQLAAVAINFSEDMEHSSLTTYDGSNNGASASVTLKQGEDYIAGTLNYNSFEHTLYLSPQEILSPNTPYTITVKTTAQNINGTPISSQFTSTFTTGATDITTTFPYITNSICDQYSCAITFSEPMKHSGDQESVNNAANWSLESPEQSAINVAGKTITYDGSTMTAKITGLALNTSDQYKITIGSTAKSTADQAIQSDNRTIYGTVISASVTGGQVGTSAAANNVDPNINGMTPINVFAEKLSAGASSTYYLNFPAKSSIPSTGQIVVTFPVGFDLTNAAIGDTPMDSDINGISTGTITYSIVKDAKARTVTLTTAGGNISTNDNVKFSIRSVQNSSIVSQAGYSLQIQLKDTAANDRRIKENLTSNKFFLAEGGTHTLTVRVIVDTNGNNIRDDGEASVNGAEVYIWSPSSGSQNERVADGQAVFENLPTDNYNVSVNSEEITDAGLNLNNSWNNIYVSGNSELTFAATAAANTISGTVTGVAGTTIDIFASGMSGDYSFKKKTGTIGGGGTYSYTLPASENSTYNVNVGPAIPSGHSTAGGLAMMPTFTFMPPAPQQVHVVSSNITGVNFNLSSLDRTISGTVNDNNGNAIPSAIIFARPTSKVDGEKGMGLSAQSDASGNYSLNVTAGEYLVSAYKPGMPFIEDQRISVPPSGPTIPATLNFRFSARIEKTITGRVLDKNGNAVSYAGIWGYKVNSTLDTTTTGGSGANNTSSQTDANGNYTLYVSEGVWNVAAAAPGIGNMPAKTIQVDGTSITGQDFNAATMDIGIVSGTAAQGASGQAGVKVMISNSTYSNNTVTSNNGTFSMNVPEGSNYTMTCFFPGSGNSSPITNITVTKDQTLTQNCTITNAIAIEVRLTDGTNPITDAFIDVRDASGNGNGTNVNQTSGIYGVYTINVPSGLTYNVSANSTTFGRIGNQPNVTEAGTITFTAPSRLYSVSGIVLNGDDVVPNAWVSIFGSVEGTNNNVHLGAQSNADGTFSIPAPNGNYKLRADKAGYISATVLSNISVRDGNNTGNSIGLFPGGYNITGTVTLSGDPVANAKIDATNADGGFTVTESDADGAYDLPVINGTWTVKARSIGYESANSTITINNGNSAGNSLTLSAIAGFTIRPSVVNTFAPSTGGFIENQNIGSKFRMSIPANALGSSENAASIHTQIDTTLPTSTTGTIFNNNAISITAVDSSGEPIKTLDGRVTIVIPYDPTVLPAGTDETTLVTAYWNPSTQSYETLATTVDTENHTLTAETDHFSSFAPMLPTGSSTPSTPTGLVASGVTASAVTLTWDTVADTTTYNIYRSTDGGSTYPFLKSVSAPAITTSDSGLTAGTEYRYKVSAENTDGESASSSNVNILTIPATPTGLASGNITSSSVDLSWDDTTGATGYKLYRNDVLIDTIADPTVTASNSSLSAGTYTYKIRAYNATGESSQSSGLEVIIAAAPGPDVPTGLAAPVVTASSVTLTWNIVATATSYKIYRSTDGGSTYPLLKSVSAPALTTDDLELTIGTNYRYKISAVNGDGESSLSLPVSITTIPATPTGFASSNATTSSTDLSWTASTGATGYKIYKNDILSSTVASPTITATSSGLSAGTYTYKISAYNTAGESSLSSEITVTIASTPSSSSSGGGGGGSMAPVSKKKVIVETKDDSKTTSPTTETDTKTEPKTEEKITLSDVESSWAKTEIKGMISKGIVKGNEEGKFKPDDNLNRADSAMLICRILKIDEKLAVDDNPFKDVEKANYFGSCVSQLKSGKITTGNADGTFKPGNSINRAEFIAFAMRAYSTFLKDQEQKDFNAELNSNYPKYSFVDVSTKQSWYANIAYVAQKEGFVMGRQCGNTQCFDGAKTITRAEATTVLYRMFMDLLNQM